MWLSSDVRASGLGSHTQRNQFWYQACSSPQHFFGFPASGGQAGLGKISNLGGWTRARHITRCDLFPLWSKYIWFVYYELNNQWLKQTQKDLNILSLSASFSFNAVNAFFIFCQFLTWIILNITIWWINSSSLHFFEFY